MFGHKYVAVNMLTNIEVKRFRTLWGAKRWYRKPMTIMGIKISKEAMFIGMFDACDIKTVEPEAQPDAFQLMQAYALEDVKATQAMLESLREPRLFINPPEVTIEPYELDDRCGNTGCLWCYGTQAEYEQGFFDNSVALLPGDFPEVKQADEQPMLPDMPVEPMPHWERELLGAFDDSFERCNTECEDCDNIERKRAAEKQREERSNADLALLRKKLTGWVPEDDYVLISCADYWDDPEHNDQTANVDLVHENELMFEVYMTELTEPYYRLTEYAVEELGEFKPATTEDDPSEIVLIRCEDYWSWSAHNLITAKKDLEMVDDQNFVVHMDQTLGSTTNGDWPLSFYQVTPDALEVLGEFKTPSEWEVFDQAEAFYQGLAGLAAREAQTEEVDYKELMEEAPVSPKQD